MIEIKQVVAYRNPNLDKVIRVGIKTTGFSPWYTKLPNGTLIGSAEWYDFFTTTKHDTAELELGYTLGLDLLNEWVAAGKEITTEDLTIPDLKKSGTVTAIYDRNEKVINISVGSSTFIIHGNEVVRDIYQWLGCLLTCSDLLFNHRWGVAKLAWEWKYWDKEQRPSSIK